MLLCFCSSRSNYNSRGSLQLGLLRLEILLLVGLFTHDYHGYYFSFLVLDILVPFAFLFFIIIVFGCPFKLEYYVFSTHGYLFQLS